MARFDHLKKTCSAVLDRLTEKGCAGIVVVFPRDSSLDLVTVNGEHALIGRRFVAACSPESAATDLAFLCEDNPVMSAAQDSLLHLFPIDALGFQNLVSLAKHDIRYLTALSFNLSGASYFCTAYFLFKKHCDVLESREQVLREVSYWAHNIWASMRACLRNDDVGIDDYGRMLIKLVQTGKKAEEIAQLLDVKRRHVEDKLASSREILVVNSTISAVVNCQILQIV